jgi:ribosomal protein L37AE/L43A
MALICEGCESEAVNFYLYGFWACNECMQIWYDTRIEIAEWRESNENLG